MEQHHDEKLFLLSTLKGYPPPCSYTCGRKEGVIREQIGKLIDHHEYSSSGNNSQLYNASNLGKGSSNSNNNNGMGDKKSKSILQSSNIISGSHMILWCMLFSILFLSSGCLNNQFVAVECSSPSLISSRFTPNSVPYLQHDEEQSLYFKLPPNNLLNNRQSSSPSIQLEQQSLPTGLDCSYFNSNENNNNLESCNSLPTEQSSFSTFTIRLTGGTDAIYGKSHPPILYNNPTIIKSSPNIKLFTNNLPHHDGESSSSTLPSSIATTIEHTNLIPNNETSYCYQVSKWLDQQQQDLPLSQIPSMCSQFFCNPKDSPSTSNLMVIQEIFSNLSRSLGENSFFPSVVTTQFSIKLTLENSTDSYHTSDSTEWITMTIAQMTRLYNYCHYCKVGNPSFELFKLEREEGKCTLPFSMNSLKTNGVYGKDSSNNTNLESTATDQDMCGQKGYSLPLLNTMTYTSLNDHRLLYYFPYRVCYCYSSSSFASKCDEWSDLYYTGNFQDGIRGMFIGLYVLQLLLIIGIVLVPLLYKHVRLGLRPSLARITTDTSSTQDLQAKLTFDENSYSFKLVSESTPKKTIKQRSRSNSPTVLPTLDPGSDSEDTITNSVYYRYESQPAIVIPDKKNPEVDTPLLDIGTPRKRKTNWKRVFKSLLKSFFDFRIIATMISITNLMAGFLSLIPTLPYDARLVLISITCVLSLMGLIPIVFQWLVVLRKIDSQDPTSHSGRHIKVLSIIVFTSTVMLFIGYMLTVIFVSGYSSVLLARYIMLVVLFLYFIICFPLLVGYGIKVYFRVLKNNNEIRFFQFKVCNFSMR